MASPLFISFEGGEGSGKTTQIKLLHDYLQAKGKPCLLTREPGGSVGGEAIRNLLFDNTHWHPVAELLLFQAARVQHVEQTIKPALKRGEIVLCDRFIDSSIVYQGMAQGLGVEYIRQLYQLTLGNFAPTFTFILDIDAETGLKRALQREDSNRFEAKDLAFHEQVRKGFLALARLNPLRYGIMDANTTKEQLHTQILKKLEAKFL